MKWLKNILVVIALLVAAAPCTHAEVHPEHSGSADAQIDILEAHHCSCHSCENTFCTEPLEVELTFYAAAMPLALPIPSTILFIIPELKSVAPQVFSTVADPLNSLQTIQLLI